jgi:hypothetical protein
MRRAWRCELLAEDKRAVLQQFLSCYHGAGGKATILYFLEPFQLVLSDPSWKPGLRPRLLLDPSIGAIAKALQALGEKPRLGAKYPEARPELQGREPAAPSNPRVRIYYLAAKNR